MSELHELLGFLAAVAFFSALVAYPAWLPRRLRKERIGR